MCCITAEAPSLSPPGYRAAQASLGRRLDVLRIAEAWRKGFGPGRMAVQTYLVLVVIPPSTNDERSSRHTFNYPSTESSATSPRGFSNTGIPALPRGPVLHYLR
jgi:hypothetical protein